MHPNESNSSIVSIKMHNFNFFILESLKNATKRWIIFFLHFWCLFPDSECFSDRKNIFELNLSQTINIKSNVHGRLETSWKLFQNLIQFYLKRHFFTKHNFTCNWPSWAIIYYCYRWHLWNWDIFQIKLYIPTFLTGSNTTSLVITIHFVRKTGHNDSALYKLMIIELKLLWYDIYAAYFLGM